MAAKQMPSDERFAFGRNWQNYLSGIIPAERVAIAGEWILQFLNLPNLTGLSVLDIGSGSGLHSLAMVQAGAARVVSFDYDPASVAATRSLHDQAGRPAHWQVLEGSVLDGDFMASLGSFDLVYSWGVLHHTGAQWQAVEQAAARVGENGQFYLALYASEHQLDTEAILALKRRYNRAGRLGRALMEAYYVWSTICRHRPANVLRLPALTRAYRESRGMSVLTDARDWLGGWPMEFSSVPEVHQALTARGLEMAKVRTGQPNTEYLFARPSAMIRNNRIAMTPDQVAAVRLPRLNTIAELPVGQRYFIFGTAHGAELFLAAAQHAGRPPAGFIDISRDGTLAGLPVYPASQLAALADTVPTDSLVVLSNAYVQENAERLWRAGFTNLLNAHPLVVAMMAGVNCPPC